MPHVTFDRRSFFVDGQRTLLQCGAFHYFRLPAPDAGAWRDALLRLRRAGYNAVDLYFPWNYHSPAPGIYDFTGVRDVPRLLRLVDEVGLYLVARPGPYICAEVDAGGLPGWLLAMEDVAPRCRQDMRHADSPAYVRYVEEWYGQIVPLILQCRNLLLFQIENEYFTEEMGDEPAHMQALYNLARRLGVTVPIMHNDVLLPALGAWSSVVDVTTVDLYPVNFSSMSTWRQDPNVFFNVDSLAESWAAVGLDCPIGLGEFQGGWFDSWGGPGYDALRAALGEDYHRLLVGSALGQGTAFYSLYMFHGGTTWGTWGEPGVYTSYDYAAPVGEAGTLTRRYYQAKRLAMTAEALAPVLTDAAPTDAVTVSAPALLYAARTDGVSTVVFLRNMTDQSAQTELLWQEHAILSKSQFEVPSGLQSASRPLDHSPAGASSERPILVTVPAHGLRIVPLNLPLGPATLTYSTAEPVLNHNAGNHRLLLLARHPDGDEVLVRVPEQGNVRFRWSGDGLAAERLSIAGATLHVLALPPHLAERVWPLGDAVLIGADFVGEVRKVSEGVEADVEMAAPGEVHVWSPGPVRVTVDGQPADASWDADRALATVHLPGPDPVALPTLGPWEVNPGSPERLPDFDDADWRPIEPDVPLHMDAQSIHRGFTWYRGRFTGPVERIVLDARHSYDVFLSGVCLASLDSEIIPTGEEPPQPQTIEIPPELCRAGENVLAVLVESLGHNKGFEGDERNPRGLLSCELEPARPIAWQVRGGLWHEGTADTLAWRDEPVKEDDPATQSGLGLVVWHRTSFTLNLPANHRVPLGLRITGTPGKVLIYLNGLLVGRCWGEMGPQTLFYLPESLLRSRDRNELVLAHWHHPQNTARAGGSSGPLGPVSLEAYPAYRRVTFRVQA